MNPKPIIIISCEHAVNTIPLKYQPLFAFNNSVLNTHRAIDFGALETAQFLSKHLKCDLVEAQTSRMLIDCNRSIKHPRCYSEITKTLPQNEKEIIYKTYYLPFRQKIIELIKHYTTQGMQVWHFSIHSFTPILKDIERTTDIGFLYDPSLYKEKDLAKILKKTINNQSPKYRIRMNYPYAGISDGFTSYLRTQFNQDHYLGLEVEMNQALTKKVGDLDKLKNTLLLSLLSIMC